jgi:MFS family permease
MQTMAQQVLVYRLTGTAVSLGIISFIGLIPVIPLSLWSGSISDRFSISLIAVSAFLSMPYSTLMPVFAENILKDSASPVIQSVCGGAIPFISCQTPEALSLGILLTMVGVGVVIGAFIVAALPNRTKRGLILTVGNVAFPLTLAGFAFSKSFIFSAALLLLIGVSFVLQNALANTILQIITPDEVRGRVMSFYTLTFQTMMRLGGLQAGFLVDGIGAPLSVGIGAIISLFYGIFIAFRYPLLRKQ